MALSQSERSIQRDLSNTFSTFKSDIGGTTIEFSELSTTISIRRSALPSRDYLCVAQIILALAKGQSAAFAWAAQIRDPDLARCFSGTASLESSLERVPSTLASLLYLGIAVAYFESGFSSIAAKTLKKLNASMDIPASLVEDVMLWAAMSNADLTLSEAESLVRSVSDRDVKSLAYNLVACRAVPLADQFAAFDAALSFNRCNAKVVINAMRVAVEHGDPSKAGLYFQDIDRRLPDGEAKRAVRLKYCQCVLAPERAYAEVIGESSRAARALESMMTLGIDESSLSVMDAAECIFLVKGIDAGRNTWYYVLVDPESTAQFKVNLKKDIIRLDDFGKVLLSAYGDEPPASTTAALKKAYRVDDPSCTKPIRLKAATSVDIALPVAASPSRLGAGSAVTATLPVTVLPSSGAASKAVNLPASGLRVTASYRIPRAALEVTMDPSTRLGGGGFGDVYRGLYRESTVAVKVVKPSFLADPHVLAEFFHEAEITWNTRQYV